MKRSIIFKSNHTNNSNVLKYSIPLDVEILELSKILTPIDVNKLWWKHKKSTQNYKKKKIEVCKEQLNKKIDKVEETTITIT